MLDFAFGSIENFLIIISCLFLLSIGTSRLTSTVGIPALLVFLVIGMLFGSEGFGGIAFDDTNLARSLSIVALGFLLFDGGLGTDWPVIKRVLPQGILLSTVGIGISTVSLGFFAAYLLDLTLLEGLLIGAIASSTDAAAVFSILRGRSLSLRSRLRSTLELESGSNDPMAIFLTVGIISLIELPGQSSLALIPAFFQQMALGALFGWGAGYALQWLINRIHLEYDGLYPVLTCSMVALLYGLTTVLGGSGFLAVYLAGLVLGNTNFLHKRSLTAFHDGLSWMMQVTMFLLLGLLVFPSQLFLIGWQGLVISLFLLLIARPLSVFLSLHFSRMNIREKFFISWGGLRGAAPIILGTFPLLAALDNAELMFHLVFFIVLTSIIFQGTTLSLVARWLRLEIPAPRKRLAPLEFLPSRVTKNDLREFAVSKHSYAEGKSIVELELPDGVLVVLVERKDSLIVPRGGTVLEVGDLVICFADRDKVSDLYALFDGGE